MADENAPIRRSINATIGETKVVATGILHSPLPDDHPFFFTIGRVVAEWAVFEHRLDLIIWEMSRVEQAVGAAITAQMLGSTNRLKTIIALGIQRRLKKQTLSKIRKLLNSSHGPNDDRNRLVHDAWYIQPSSGQLGQFRSMASKDLRFGLVDINEDEVNNLLEKIRGLTEEAKQFHTTISDELGSSRR